MSLSSSTLLNRGGYSRFLRLARKLFPYESAEPTISNGNAQTTEHSVPETSGLVLVNKTTEILHDLNSQQITGVAAERLTEYLARRWAYSNKPAGLVYSHKEKFFYILPHTTPAPTEQSEFREVSRRYFPGVSQWATRNGNHTDDPYAALFRAIASSDIFPLMMEKSYFVGRVSDVQCAPDFSRISASLGFHKER